MELAATSPDTVIRLAVKEIGSMVGHGELKRLKVVYGARSGLTCIR